MNKIKTQSTLQVTNCHVFPLKNPTGKLRAYAIIVLNDELKLTSLRIYEGNIGLFLSYPNDNNYAGEDYRQLFYPLTSALRNHIEEIVLEKYAQVKGDINV